MSPRGRSWLFAGMGAVLLLVAGGRHGDLVARRGAEGLQFVAPEDTTPLVAMTTVAFGAFRGLVADALWMRASELQENGQYFELVQLATWISQLEPTIPEVWEFQAWNLAYNISVLFPDPEDRWRWVSHGLELLRTEGLQHNPVSPVIHWNIGWMFQHKIGMDFDQAHLFYKAELAREAEAAFGGADPEAVRRVFRMEPERVAALEGRFGPIDWRLPIAHSLYWSDRGLEFARRDAFRARNLQRMRLQSLAELLRRGEMLTNAEGAPLLALPRFGMMEALLAEMDRLEADPFFAQIAKTSLDNFLMEAVVLHAEYGKAAETAALYARLAARVPELQSGQEGLMTLLAERGMPQDSAQMSRDQAMIRLTALLVQARGWDAADAERARGYRSLARQMHRRYQSTRRSGEHFERTHLPPFEAMDAAIREHVAAGAVL